MRQMQSLPRIDAPLGMMPRQQQTLPRIEAPLGIPARNEAWGNPMPGLDQTLLQHRGSLSSSPAWVASGSGGDPSQGVRASSSLFATECAVPGSIRPNAPEQRPWASIRVPGSNEPWAPIRVPVAECAVPGSIRLNANPPPIRSSRELESVRGVNPPQIRVYQNIESMPTVRSSQNMESVPMATARVNNPLLMRMEHMLREDVDSAPAHSDPMFTFPGIYIYIYI